MAGKKNDKVAVLIPAAGMGKRMGKDRQKQFLMFGDMPVLAHTLKVFEGIDEVNEIIIIVPRGEEEFCLTNIVERYKIHKVTKVIAGGKERQDSVYNGLKLISDDTAFVIVHDGVRPFIRKDIIKRSIELAKEADGVVAGVPAKDTIKRVSNDMFVEATMNRQHLWLIQTPQTFKYKIINEAYNKAYINDYYGTDDASLVERLGYKIKVIMDSYENIKITTPEDMIFAETIYKSRGKE
ncbi:MAG: 2-C-methyl-D-erythritol 4-phosphate cytidylyltransferase [Nitrospirae bacterium]|nr:2-C-methyl-D-erythritol 4-phosphate cytidylyltransferase [Nitrospirota bacterium]